MILPRLRRRRRSRRDRLALLVVFAGLVAFVASVYVVVVLGGGAIIGQTKSPHLGLSVLATAIVALAFEPVQARLELLANQLFHGGRLSPYEVLSRFSEAVTGSYSSEEVPARMAKVLAEGTGAQWAQVWLVVQNEPALEATWPPEQAATGDRPAPGREPRAGQRSLVVRHAGELLGVLRIQERERQPLTPVEERLFAGLAAQAGLVLRAARLRAEKERGLLELSARAEELRLSRERLVDTQDAERRSLERDIHDGAQQHLVALAVNLRLVQTLATRSPERGARLLSEQADAAQVTIDGLISLSRGIYPPLLTSEGIVAALRSAVATSPIPVELVDDNVGRYTAEVEAAIYFCCLEALQNAAKHSGASRVAVALSGTGGQLSLSVTDDGRGFDPETVKAGAGLANMRDRVDSLGGRLVLTAGSEAGTHVSAWVPAAPLLLPSGG